MESANLDRRSFLKLGGGALLGALALTAVQKPQIAAAAPEDFTGYPDRYGMLTDTTKCVGCRCCEAACNQAHGLPAPPTAFSNKDVFVSPRKTETTAWTVVNRYNTADGATPVYRKVQCMHCNEPACASACPVGALKKTPEGPVIYDESLCIGCRYCMNACPYTMLTYSYDDPLTPAIHKCVMCYERITQGSIPACAGVCPSKATIFGKRSDLLKIAQTRIDQAPTQYVNHIFGQTEAGGAGWLYLSAVPFTQLGFPADLGSTSYPEFTRDWLLAVPLVIILWPTFLMGLRYFNKRQALVEAQAAGKGETLK